MILLNYIIYYIKLFIKKENISKWIRNTIFVE